MRRQSFSKLLGGLMSAGVLGLSSTLAPCAAAVSRPAASSDRQDVAVAERLSAVRAAVTEAVLELPSADVQESGVQRVWWGNHGWGRPWRWGGGGWRNGGWGNGGWGNWHPWGNGGWGNWHP